MSKFTVSYTWDTKNNMIFLITINKRWWKRGKIEEMKTDGFTTVGKRVRREGYRWAEAGFCKLNNAIITEKYVQGWGDGEEKGTTERQ